MGRKCAGAAACGRHRPFRSASCFSSSFPASHFRAVARRGCSLSVPAAVYQRPFIRGCFHENAVWSFFCLPKPSKNVQKAFSPVLNVWEIGRGCKIATSTRWGIVRPREGGACGREGACGRDEGRDGVRCALARDNSPSVLMYTVVGLTRLKGAVHGGRVRLSR